MAQNITPKFTYEIRRKQRALDAQVNQPKIVALDAFLGDNQGQMQTFNGKTLAAGYVVVRDYDGNLSVAYNQRVPLVANLAIKVGYDPLQPTLFQVLSQRDSLGFSTVISLPYHHTTHEWPGPDTVFVHSEQFLPGLLLGNSGLVVTIFPFYYRKLDNSRGYIAYQSLNLAPYVPASGAQAFTICAGDDGLLHVVAGSTQPSPAMITVADFPPIPDNTLHEMWGVRLYYGQSTVQQIANYTDSYDFRFGGLSGGGGGHIILDPTAQPLTQRTNLGFSGAGVTVIDDVPDDTTQVIISTPHLHGLARWAGLATQTTFELPDVADSLDSVQIAGVSEDPLLYSLSSDGSQLVLAAGLAHDAIVTANYLVMLR